MHGLCPPQTATALPLRLGEVNWARLPAHSLCCVGRLLLGCTEPAPPAGDHSVPRSPVAGPQEERPRRNSAWGLKALAHGSRAWVQAPRPHPLGQALLRILGLPALPTCSAGPGLCRNPLALALALSWGCSPPPAKVQRPHSGGAGPWGQRSWSSQDLSGRHQEGGANTTWHWLSALPCVAGENRGGRHEPQRREPCRRRILWCSGRGRLGEQVGSGP